MRVRSAGENPTCLEAAAAEAPIEAGGHALALRVADRHLRRGGGDHEEEQQDREHEGMLCGMRLRNAKGPAIARGALAEPSAEARGLLHADRLAATLSVTHIE